MKHVYESKSKTYYTHVRTDIITLLPKNPEQKVLEIGAGGGYTLHFIKEQQFAAEVYGIELFEISDSYQNHPDFRDFIIADIEKEFPKQLQQNYFDVIICADVLEHLVDPWTVIDKLTKLLKPNGKFIISLPNIREFNTILTIFLKGDFRYTPEGGIMDKTHLRFFCKRNAVELLTTTELEVEMYQPNFKLLSEAKKRRLLNKITLGVFEELLTYQHLVVAQKRK